MRRRFFVDKFCDGTAALRGETAEHLGRVLRAEPGQLYELSDGERVWLGRVEQVAVSKRGEDRIAFSLVEPVEVRESPLKITLLISLVKFDRFEWCLEKATELGVDEIIPLAAARSDKPLIAAAGKRHSRWQRILLESAQQSRRLRPPSLGEVSSSSSAFSEARAGCRVILSERAEAPPLRSFLDGHSIETAVLAIGPEGGWTEDEFMSAGTAGFNEASLGETILRTETAVLAALAILRFGFAN